MVIRIRCNSIITKFLFSGERDALSWHATAQPKQDFTWGALYRCIVQNHRTMITDFLFGVLHLQIAILVGTRWISRNYLAPNANKIFEIFILTDVADRSVSLSLVFLRILVKKKNFIYTV